MFEFILNPWPWWLSGILIGSIVPFLFLLAGKAFGISSSYQEIGSICFPSGLKYLEKYSYRSNLWILFFVVGIVIGGYLATNYLSNNVIEFYPKNFNNTFTYTKFFVGGIFIGFGARYAGGCTSGHSITGISNLNWPSLIATIMFFIGGVSFSWVFGNFFF